MYYVYKFGSSSGIFKHVQTKRKSVPDEQIYEKINHDVRLDNSLSRTKRLFREYALCNKFDLFVTFTFSSDSVDRYDYIAVKKKITKFFNNYQQRIDRDFRYMVIPELHKDGAYHFHGLCTDTCGMHRPKMIKKRIKGVLCDVPNTPGYFDFPAFSDKLGYFSASTIRNYEKTVNYITSYITKSFTDKSFIGQRLLLKSSGLEKPELVYTGLDEMVLSGYKDYDFCKVAYADCWETAPFYSHWSVDLALNYLPRDGSMCDDYFTELIHIKDYELLQKKMSDVVTCFNFEVDMLEFEQLHINQFKERG